MKKEQTILIVDDTSTNIEILLDLLKDYDLLVATNGQNALEIANSERLDLILLDIMMPQMDGYEVCKKLKSDPKTQNIPVIFITANTDEDSIEKSFEMGVIDYVAKPFKPKELIARVKTHLKISSLINNLEDKNEEINHILNTTMEAVFIFEGDSCTEVNEEALRLFRCKDKCDVIGKKISLFGNFKKVIEGDLTPYEIDARKCDGSYFPALVRANKMYISDKEITLYAILDLSDIKDKEAMLNQRSKIESMSEMITNIAHQWRQPLSVISTSASGMMLQKEFGLLNDDLIVEYNRAIIKSCDRLSNTINDFQELMHSQNEDDKDTFYLDIMLKDIKYVFDPHLKRSDIVLHIEIDKEFEVFSYKRGLEQVLSNIIKNAKDIVADKDGDKYIFIKAKKNGKTLIEIYDNGGGIDEDNIQKVFEPYYTTKHKKQGTGLGLYSSFNILQNIGGSINVENVEFKFRDDIHKGAKFTIEI